MFTCLLRVGKKNNNGAEARYAIRSGVRRDIEDESNVAIGSFVLLLS